MEGWSNSLERSWLILRSELSSTFGRFGFVDLNLEATFPSKSPESPDLLRCKFEMSKWSSPDASAHPLYASAAFPSAWPPPSSALHCASSQTIDGGWVGWLEIWNLFWLILCSMMSKRSNLVSKDQMLMNFRSKNCIFDVFKPFER